MRWIGAVIVLLAAGAVWAEPESEPSPEELRATIQGMRREERNAYLARFTEAQLDRLLDRIVTEDRGAYLRRVVSRALGWKVLDRRTAGLRALAPSEAALSGAPRFSVLAYPRTDGSTSTIPLERLVACRLFGSPYAWGGPPELRTLDDPFVGPPSGGLIGLGPRSKERPTKGTRAARSAVVADVTAPGNARLAKVINYLIVKHTGTHGAWVNLIEGNADLIFVARAPSPDEKTLAAEEGVELDAAPVAKDAFVFLVNRVNPVESLTLDQIRGIYTAKIETWDAVGGPSEKIEAYQRNANSGSQQLFLERVMGEQAPVTPSRDLIRNSMAGPYNAVAERTTGLGYTVWYYERYMACLPEVKPIAIDGVLATPATIADGTYPIVTTVYAAVRADEPATSPARRLRDWLLTESGQAVVAESGYIPAR